MPTAATNLVAVGAGWQHGLALRGDGTLVPWGYTGDGQGMIPPGATNIVAMAVGDYHNLALRADGKVFAWGKNEAGESTVPDSATNIVALDGGYSHTLALRADGTVTAWGDNTFGQSNIPAGATNVVAIAAGMDHNVVLKADGSLVVWGIGQDGETNLPPTATNVVAISVGASHSLALRADGTLVAWGSTVFGETTVPTNAINVRSISSGGWFNLAVLNDGGTTGWGYDYSHQATPPTVITNPIALYAGGEFSIAWLRDPSNGVAPRIWKNPVDQAVAGGGTVFLHPGVSGTGPLRYQWHFTNAPLAGQTNRWLVLPNANVTQTGGYFLVASNDFGAVTSGVANVTVAGLSFTTQPTSTNAIVNTTVTLDASVTGTAPLVYRWQKDGQDVNDTNRVAGSSTTALTISNALAVDTGSYRLIVGNSYGAITSDVAVVTVLIPQPLLNIDFGINLVSSKTGFAAVGQTDADYWNGFPAGPYASSNLCLADGSQTAISVTVTNSLFARWIEYTDPMLHEFIYSPYNAGPFTVKISGLPAGTYSFYLYNAGFKYWPWLGTDFELIVGGTSVGHNVLSATIADPPPWQEGVDYGTFHKVRVTGPQQSIALVVRGYVQDASLAGLQIAAFLSSNAAPVFFSQPASQSVPLGTNFVLMATGNGFPSPEQQWFFNGVPMADTSRITGAQSNRLSITSAQFEDAGDYYAVLTNSSGAITSVTATIAVGIPPGFAAQPSNQTWIAGSPASLAATGTGTGPLAYQWYFNSATLTNNSRLTGTTSNIFSVSNVLTSDAGTYTLVVTNPFGSIASTATVAVVVPPAFTRQPVGASVPVGMPLTLSVTATGTAPLGYQWRFNGTNVPVAVSNTLNFTALAASDFGGYQVVVSNYGGVITSAVAQVTVGQVAVWGSYPSGNSPVPIWPGPGLTNVIAVAGGTGFSLALRADGTVYSWGSSTSVPAGLNNVVAIAAKGLALALRSDGTVVAWGVGTAGQTNVPASLSNVIAVAAGDSHSAALRRDGTVVVWGGTAAQRQTNMPPGLMQVRAVAAGGAQTLAVRRNGDVIGWGGSTPASLPPYLHGVVQVAVAAASPAAGRYNLGLLTNGTVTGWDTSGWPTNIFPGITNVVAVETAGGTRDQLAGSPQAGFILRSDGVVSGWAPETNTLTNVPPGLSNAVAISGGSSHVLALVNTGQPLIVRPPSGGTFYTGAELRLTAAAVGQSPLAFQWFKDGTPVLDATNQNLLIPAASTTDFGSYHLLVTNELGTAQSIPAPVSVIDSAPVFMSQPASNYIWYGSPAALGASVIGSGPMQLTWFQDGIPVGSNTNELRFGRVLPQHGGAYQLVESNAFGVVTSSVAQLTFSKVATWSGAPGLTNAPVDLGSVLAVASGYIHGLAIRSNRTVAVWGTTGNNVTNVPVGLSNVVAISGGNNFSVALKDDGTVVSWGVAVASVTNVPAGLSNVVAISAGGAHTLALRGDGTVAAWGIPTAGVTGVTNVPANLSNVVAIAAGATHSLALKDDGTVVPWGTYGVAPALSNIVAISAGYNHSLALRANGTVVSWTSAKAPAPPAGLSNVVAISAGGNATTYLDVALRADGTLVAWGDNTVGQLSIPPDLMSATAISAGGSSTLALLNDRSPTVTVPAWDRRVAAGTNVTLGLLAVGQPGLSFQWYHNGEAVAGGTSNWLAFTNTEPSQSGAYQLLAMNDFGAVTSAVATLTVSVPAVQLTSLNLAPEGFKFSFTSVAGVLYVVEFKDDLVTGPWLELERRFGVGGLEIVTDSSAAGVARFYRVRALFAPRPKVGPVAWNGNEVSFSFPTVPGAVYVVQYKDHLEDPAWQELSRQTGTGEPLVVSDPESTAPSRFYRVRVE